MSWAFTHRTNPNLDTWADEPDYSMDGEWYYHALSKRSQAKINSGTQVDSKLVQELRNTSTSYFTVQWEPFCWYNLKHWFKHKWVRK